LSDAAAPGRPSTLGSGSGRDAEGTRSLFELIAAPFVWVRDVWRRIRAWRRISFTSGGLVFTLGAFAVGFAAMNTGNNLLYLLLGSMLGFIVVSGWLSEKAISGLRFVRLTPRAVTVGQPMLLRYHVRNLKTRLPSLAVEITEAGLPDSAFLAHVAAESATEARSTNSFVRRGIYPLESITLSTGFPFGMFLKKRDIALPGEVVVWPRSDRAVRAPSPGGGKVPRMGASARGAAGHRGEYRSLRAYRPGDDPRDIHWKSFARTREPVIREYERDGAETRWICLDTQCEPGDPAEVAVEVAASLAASAVAESRPFALVTTEGLVDPGEGPGQLDRVLDALARVDFGTGQGLPSPPVDPAQCILVSVDGAAGFGDVIAVGRDAKLDGLEDDAA
jgi:uncharacterized protein (DUF58 family)